MVSSTVGSPTSTCWKRRSRAASVSMWMRVLVERGGADHVQVAPGQRRLQHVGGVEGAVGLAGPHHDVHLVDERDDAATRLDDLLQHSLQPRLELAPQRRAGHHGGDVEGDDLPVGQRAGYVPGGDALGEPLHDGGLADAGLADEDRVVLGAPGQHLHGAADLIVPPDHRVQPVLPSQRRQIPTENLQSTRRRLPTCHVAMLRVAICHTLYNTPAQPHIPPITYRRRESYARGFVRGALVS